MILLFRWIIVNSRKKPRDFQRLGIPTDLLGNITGIRSEISLRIYSENQNFSFFPGIFLEFLFQFLLQILTQLITEFSHDLSRFSCRSLSDLPPEFIPGFSGIPTGACERFLPEFSFGVLQEFFTGFIQEYLSGFLPATAAPIVSRMIMAEDPNETILKFLQRFISFGFPGKLSNFPRIFTRFLQKFLHGFLTKNFPGFLLVFLVVFLSLFLRNIFSNVCIFNLEIPSIFPLGITPRRFSECLNFSIDFFQSFSRYFSNGYSRSISPGFTNISSSLISPIMFYKKFRKLFQQALQQKLQENTGKDCGSKYQRNPKKK